MRVGCQYERVRYSRGGTISCGMTLSSKAHTLCVHVVQCSHIIAYSKLLNKLHSSKRNNFSRNRNYSAQLES